METLIRIAVAVLFAWLVWKKFVLFTSSAWNYFSEIVKKMSNNQKRFFLFWSIAMSIHAGLIFLEKYVLTDAMGIEIPWLNFDRSTTFGWALFLLQTVYTIAGFRIVGPTELGARLFFGLPMNNLSSGLTWIPPFICHLEKETKLIIQSELPAEPEEIYHGKDPVVPTGKFPPIRIPFGGTSEGKGNPYDERMTQEVVPVIRWKIKDFCVFLSTIGDTEKAKKQMEDGTVSMLLRAFGKITPGKALSDIETHDKDLTNEIKERVSGWGIDLESAKIKLINFSADLNSSIQKIAEETAGKEALIRKSQGVKEKKVLEGKGDAEAEKAILFARTRGLKKMADHLGVKAEAVLGSETARNVTNNPGQKTFIAGSGGFADVMSVAAVAGNAFRGGKPPLKEKSEEGGSDDK